MPYDIRESFLHDSVRRHPRRMRRLRGQGTQVKGCLKRLGNSRIFPQVAQSLQQSERLPVRRMQPLRNGPDLHICVSCRFADPLQAFPDRFREIRSLFLDPFQLIAYGGISLAGAGVEFASQPGPLTVELHDQRQPRIAPTAFLTILQ